MMDFKAYENAEELSKIEAEIKKVNPALHIGEICVVGKRACSCGVSFTLAGRAYVVRKLIELGWRLDRRFKIGGVFYQRMLKDIGGEKNV